MRFRALLAKDFRLLFRTPSITVLLIFYPALVAVLMGLAVGKPPAKPHVILVNEVPKSQRNIDVGSLVQAAQAPRERVRGALRRLLRTDDGDVLSHRGSIRHEVADHIGVSRGARRPLEERAVERDGRDDRGAHRRVDDVALIDQSNARSSVERRSDLRIRKLHRREIGRAHV